MIERNLDKEYFYQNLTSTEWKEISEFISSALSDKNLDPKNIEYFFSQYPNLYKGEQNIKKLREILNDAIKPYNWFLSFFFKKNIEIESYKKLSNFIINKYHMVKPSIFEVHFFPNSAEEIYLINLISKTQISLDIAMFTINNVRIAEEIKNIFYRGINVRIISDGKYMRRSSSNIYSLAAEGIKIKVNDSFRYHMHHKFCVIDNSIVVTGSFNWTDQAVNHNQENLLFIENKNLAIKYSNEFQRLWDDFEITVNKKKALLIIKEDEEKKIAAANRRKRDKVKKLLENKIRMEEIGIDNSGYGYNNYSKKKRNRNKPDNIDYNNELNGDESNCSIF